jgi:alkanesulfonate monooxygenase SsuD/methylene tetrahydromethanopterin reductase-like flavin-dependent oxidoreductase (luciferase family)
VRLGFYLTGSATSSYADLIAQVVELDEAGWDSVWLRERHFHRDYGGRNFFSSPLAVAAHLAQLTSNIRLGIGARILPLDHPLHVAEVAATVDVISGGRLDLGIARIGEQELYQRAFGTTGEASRGRFEEAIEILLRAWSGEPFAWQGEHFSFPEMAVSPRPLQHPHPPVFLVGISSSTLELGARYGFPLLIAGAATEDLVRRTQDDYAALLRAAGHDDSLVLPVNRFVYVGEDDEQALRDTREAVMTFINRGGSVIRDFIGLPPDQLTYERLIDEVFIIGGPERCAERIGALAERVRLDDLVLTFNYFSLSHDRCLASMRRFTAEVVPVIGRELAAAGDSS